MPDWAWTLAGVLGGLLLCWLVLMAALWTTCPDELRLRELLRLLPDVLRLVRRLAGDGTLPRGVRVRLWLLLAYLAFPIDLVPDFVPVLGHADDAIVVALVLRSVVRRAGADAIDRHWPGTPDGLAALRRASRL
ncbi:YkvA family protein [Geodermatophilus maliterrae]|uniref:YkvA family protein n=1 Tax=Geodermatophilus maliterrae TaxID=3162531 RepID=A0ABV3X8Z7_9ACTN